MRILRTSLLVLLALGFLGVHGTASAALLSGLVAYYPLDGNPNDSSVNANNMTENGAVSYSAGRVGQAVSLDGVSLNG